MTYNIALCMCVWEGGGGGGVEGGANVVCESVCRVCALDEHIVRCIQKYHSKD